MKHERMERHLASLDLPVNAVQPVEFLAYFAHFNRAEYYEAHDALEHLWLRTEDAERDFFKGLIQFAGAFVHLRLHYLAPDHPKHGKRLAPAARLFRLAETHITPFGPERRGFSVERAVRLCQHYVERLGPGGHTLNPWCPASAPYLELRAV
jgi:hypothetical protein